MSDRYLGVPYVKYGRAMAGADCWGLVRMARHELFGLPLLPEFGAICPDDKPALTVACEDVRQQGGFLPCEPTPGAIATAWRGALCIHVGLIVEADGRLWVLETNEKGGPCLTPITKFEARYTRVIYYAD